MREWKIGGAIVLGVSIAVAHLGAGVNAPPITYLVNGEQYLAVAAATSK
jgi:enolase